MTSSHPAQSNSSITPIDRHVAAADRGGIQSVHDLESVFSKPQPITYLRYRELPARAVVYLAGDSESGKSTLACAWARDATRNLHAVLLLDSDRNPRAVIVDRLRRLGVSEGDLLLNVWDVQQEEEPPQPNDGRVLEWVEDMAEQTEKSPLVICDSLISFLPPSGNDNPENNSFQMRAFFNRCRAITRVGGTVLVLHHLGKKGTPRGSSDFKPASDQGFLVSNYNPTGSRLLCHIKLEVDKSRYGLTGDIGYNYENGLMVRADARDADAVLTSLLELHPGAGTNELIELAKSLQVSDKRVRGFLARGIASGRIKREGKKGPGYRHFLQPAGGER